MDHATTHISCPGQPSTSQLELSLPPNANVQLIVLQRRVPHLFPTRKRLRHRQLGMPTVARASLLSHSTGPEPSRSVAVHDDDSSSNHGSILSEGERIVRNNSLVVDDRESESPPRRRSGTAQALPLHPPHASPLARAASAPGLSLESWQRFLRHTSDHFSDKSSEHRDAAVAAGLMLSQRRSSSELSRSLSDLDPITSLNAAVTSTGLQRRASSAARRRERELSEYSRDPFSILVDPGSLSVQVADAAERRYTTELLARDGVILGLKMEALERDKLKELAAVKREREREHEVAVGQKEVAAMQQRNTALDALHTPELEGQIELTRNALVGTYYDDEMDTLIRTYHDEKDTLIYTHYHKKDALICRHQDEKDALILTHYEQKDALILTHYDEKDTLTRTHCDEMDTLIRAHYDQKDALNSKFNTEKSTLIRTHYDQKDTLIRTHYDERNALIAEFNKEKNALIAEFNKEKNTLISEYTAKTSMLREKFNKDKIELNHQRNNNKNALIRRSDDENRRAVLALEKDKIILVGEYKELEVEKSYLREELKRYKAAMPVLLPG